MGKATYNSWAMGKATYNSWAMGKATYNSWAMGNAAPSLSHPAACFGSFAMTVQKLAFQIRTHYRYQT
jgi:hypothetical protein